ncbi:latent-transforming growth factor beta-binding protein 1-like [Liolophura sinensis]|uniref:latent-transforming growth factor beta-binding protein 1-like n=1 Tax=Liolophura sinensis TaxID=3198878 RepID=UPI003158D24E
MHQCWSPFISVQLVDLHTACDPENDTQVCPDSSTCRIFGCSAHVCTCDNGTSPNAMEDKCVRPAEIGDQCDEGNRCVGFRVSCIRGRCGCGEGLEAVENSCAVRYEGFAPKLLGQSCMSRTDCDQSYFVDCVDEKCQCDRAIGFREPTNDERYLQPTYTNAFQCRSDALSLDRVDKSCSTVKTVLVGDVCCELLTKCPDNATPSNSSCDDDGNLCCRCDHGYAPNSDNTKCLPLVELGESCGETVAVCRGSPSVLRCDSNTEKCICGQDLVVSDPNADHKWCVPEPAGILVSRSLGEECSMSFMTTSFKVCSRDYEQNCVGGVCTCRTAFKLRPATPYEIYEDYTSDRQCRPDSSVNGTRTDWCHDAQPLVDQEAIDSQERMLFLHRTLPILLGGVAFSILLIVGFVVYRRRKRARAMAQRDDISMSSFGSSGSESPLDDNDVLRRVGRFRDDRNWMMNSQHFNPTTR